MKWPEFFQKIQKRADKNDIGAVCSVFLSLISKKYSEKTEINPQDIPDFYNSIKLLFEIGRANCAVCGYSLYQEVVGIDQVVRDLIREEFGISAIIPLDDTRRSV